MIQVFASIWALLVGIVLIMLGNGMHFTLIGLRGEVEGFSPAALAIVTSGYFIGFLSGAQTTPMMIRRVGHVRVFAALGSFMSAGLVAFPLIAEPWAWTVLRILVGFCMSGIYVTAESWLNDAATNETRGKVLSSYMIAQTLGIIGAQGLLTLGDAATSALFIGASILVSISFAPILLSITPLPAAEVTRPMPLRELVRGSPLGTIGIFLLGAVYATQSGMGAVFGTQIGMTANQISLFVAMLFAGALLLQYPIGWLSDRMDRRKLIFGAATLGAASCAIGWFTGGGLYALMAAAFLAGGVTTPLYALFLAYTNDGLPTEDMPAASGGLVLSFAPILLSVTAAPVTEVARPMSLRALFAGSPLGTVGIFLLGSIYATQSGMGAVFGTEIGMTTASIALFVAMLFAGALVLQYPVGWLSDRMDRRWLIFGAAALGAASCALGWIAGDGLGPMLADAFVAGGVTTPLYALFLAYTNDYLSSDEMPAASGGLVFTFGMGAILGPLLTGWAMEQAGPFAFWLVLGATFGAIALYALYRMTQRAAVPVEQTESYIGVSPSASPVAVGAASTWAAEQGEADARS